MITKKDKNIFFYLRKMYLILLTFFLAVLYPLRLLILINNPLEYELQYISYIPFKVFYLEKIPIKSIVIFIIILYLIGAIIPKKIILKEIPHYKVYKFIFFLQNIFYTLILLLGFYKMGKEMGMFTRILLGLVDGVLGRDFIFIIILINKLQYNKKFVKEFLLYSLPSILMGSKSGIITALIYCFALFIGFDKKIFNLKNLLILLLSYFSYPLLYALSWVVRLGGSIDTKIFRDFSIYKPLELISKRVTAIDILMADKVNTILTKFSLSFFVEKILAAVFTRGLISRILGKDIIPYGVEFSREIMNQPKDVINGFEPTFFGVIYYSKSMWKTGVLFIVVLFICIVIACLLSKKNYYLYLVIFLITFIITIMTGIFVNIFILFRYWIIFNFINLLIRSANRLRNKRSFE